jgi:hypothetical protein
MVKVLADGMKAAGAVSASASLFSIASFLSEFSSQQMATLVLQGSKVAPLTTESTGSDILCDQAAAHLDLLANVLTSGGGKSEAIKDVKSLAKLLRSLGESETLLAALDRLRDAMMPKPIDQQITDFIERLKKEKGTPAFERTFAELKNSQLKREHVVAVATSVYGSIKKSASRRAALEYARKPHDAYMNARRGIEATGGRSAA